VSAVPEFMGLPPPERVRLTLVEPASPRRPDKDGSLQTFWHWFAVGVLLFCWIAEATLCAQRGF
jgi:apolipoprotein N-acyltransferase